MTLTDQISNTRLWSQHGVSISWAISILMLVATFSYIGFTEYSFHQKKSVDEAPQQLSPIRQKSRTSYRVADITSANLFGDPTPQKVVRENIRKTNLNLRLIGILWSNDQNFARVIIQSGNKKALLYGVGDSIQGASASVKEILDNEILLNRNGAIEKLALVKKDSKDIISYVSSGFNDAQVVSASYGERRSESNIERSTGSRPISPNGENRKVRKPNFSSLDRALKKMNEL
ncbi:MAG: hypothetical protein MK188_03915 [Gammaproteobacteria bacterium]|nr:hypothetical protein [Gammaproteobacteria bacterium]